MLVVGMGCGGDGGSGGGCGGVVVMMVVVVVVADLQSDNIAVFARSMQC